MISFSAITTCVEQLVHNPMIASACCIFYIYLAGLHTGFFPRGGKFSKTILHVKATHKTLLTIYVYMYAYYCIVILRFGGELKLGVGNPRAPPLLYATLLGIVTWLEEPRWCINNPPVFAHTIMFALNFSAMYVFALC